MEDMHIHIRDILDEKITIDELLLSLKNHGINKVCLLEHGLRVSPKHEGILVSDEAYKLFVDKINKISNQSTDIKVYSGIEMDYSDNLEFNKMVSDYINKHKFDYIVGGIHGYKFDNSRDYFTFVMSMVENARINVLAHLKMYEDWFKYKELLVKIVKLCRDNNVVIEINTSNRSIWNSEQMEYMLDIMSKYNVDYSIGSDAHDIDEIAINYELIPQRIARGE